MLIEAVMMFSCLFQGAPTTLAVANLLTVYNQQKIMTRGKNDVM